jgi:hypothetical protein
VPINISKVENAENPPCRCCICKDDIARWYIDTGFRTAFEGHIYICVNCLAKMVKVSEEFYTIEHVQKYLNEPRQIILELREQKALTDMWMKNANKRFQTIREALNE